mgnify:CR=1 FL=1
MKSKKVLKRCAALLAAIILVLSAVVLNNIIDSASAQTYSGTCGDNLTWTLDTGTGTLTISGEGEMEDFSSKSPWYDYNSSIKTVELPDKLTSIGDRAFEYCSELTSITIPGGVTSIGDRVFYNCSSLTSITIPAGVKSVGYCTFTACRSLTSVDIPNGVTSIGNRAFSRCSSLKSITIPDSVTSIGWEAFDYCISLTSITIPAGVTNIDAGTFSGCSSLTLITIPNGVISIGNLAFAGCSSFTSIIIPESVTSIGTSAFMKCSSLFVIYNNSNVKLTCGNTDDGNNAKAIVNKDGTIMYAKENGVEYFLDSDEFLFKITDGEYFLIAYVGKDTRVVLPDSVNGNAYKIFNMRGVVEAVLPDSKAVNKFIIGQNAISVVYIYPSDVFISDDANTFPENVIIHGFKGSTAQVYAEKYNRTFVDMEEACAHEMQGRVIISNDKQTAYTKYTCSKCSYNYKENYTGIIKVEDKTYGFIDGNLCTTKACGDSLVWTFDAETGTLTIVGEGDMNDYSYNANYSPWYDYMSSIKIVKLPDKLTSIGECAFVSCINLTSITIPGSVINIGEMAFASCINLTSVTIPGSVTSIGGDAFRGCSSLTTITIPDGVTSIGDSAFYSCSNLTSVTIPGSATSIGQYAFHSCSSLILITIQEGVISIGDGAFSCCSSLTSITIPNGVTSIGRDAFSICSSLTTIIIPDGVTNIGNHVFYGCRSLISITIPNGVTSIGDSAFYNCSSLTSITIPDSVTSIGQNAFYDCDSLFVIYNNSDIKLTFGSTDNGYIALNAKAIVNKDGTITYAEEDGVEYFLDSNGFLFKITGGEYFLIAYAGKGTRAILPDSVNGNAYKILDMRGAAEVVLPDSDEANVVFGQDAFKNSLVIRDVYIYNTEAVIYDDANTFPENVIIHGFKGSTAQAYAEKYNRTFVDMAEDCEHEMQDKVTISDDGQTAYIKYTCSECGYNYKENYTGVIKVGDKIYEFVDGNRSVINNEYIVIDNDIYHVINDSIEALYTDCVGGAINDFDGDGKINEADADYFLMSTYFPEDFPTPTDGYDDLNDDGVLNSDDAMIVKDLIKNIGDVLENNYR